MTTFIYGLECPLSKQIRYVGKSNNPTKRLKDHMWNKKDMSPEKEEWVSRLKSKGLKPALQILEEVDLLVWKACEAKWTEFYKAQGINILNKRSGNGLTVGNKQTFRAGHRPWNKK